MDRALIITLPLVTALIGWLTNKLAIYMLFHPRQAIKIGPWRWQGLIPRRQQDIAAQAGEIVEKELLQDHVLAREMRNMDFGPQLHDFVDELVGKAMVERIRGIPFVGGFLNDGLVNQMVTMAKEEVDNHSEKFLDRVVGEVETQIKVRGIVEERLAQLDLVHLEKLVHRIAGREFRAIEWLGGILGLLIGLVQLGILLVNGSLSW